MNDTDFSDMTGNLSIHVWSFSKELNPAPVRLVGGQEEKCSKHRGSGEILDGL